MVYKLVWTLGYLGQVRNGLGNSAALLWAGDGQGMPLSTRPE